MLRFVPEASGFREFPEHRPSRERGLRGIRRQVPEAQKDALDLYKDSVTQFRGPDDFDTNT